MISIQVFGQKIMIKNRDTGNKFDKGPRGNPINEILSYKRTKLVLCKFVVHNNAAV
jgi:hypothetical protein